MKSGKQRHRKLYVLVQLYKKILAFQFYPLFIFFFYPDTTQQSLFHTIIKFDARNCESFYSIAKCVSYLNSIKK